MKILLLGSRGMLGQALCQTLSDTDLTTWDQKELDITQAVDVQMKISALRPTIIINAAAYTNVDGAEVDQKTAFTVNRDGVANIAKVAQEIGATMVHYSTDYVFPGEKKAGYLESDQAGPALNIYGASKLAGEKSLQEIAPKYFLIRTAWLYGPGGKNFVDTMCQLGATKKTLSVVNDQYGCPTYTVDLAQATRQLLNNKYQPGIYHLVNSGQTTWYDFAREIFQLSNLDIKVDPISSTEYPRPARRPTYSILSNTKFSPLRPWKMALAEYLTI